MNNEWMNEERNAYSNSQGREMIEMDSEYDGLQITSRFDTRRGGTSETKLSFDLQTA